MKQIFTSPNVSGEEIHTLKQAAGIFKGIAHHYRIKIIDTILANKNCMTQTEMYTALQVEQSECSQHLAYLKKAGVVYGEREGKFIYYHVKEDRIKEIISLAESLLNGTTVLYQPIDGA